MALLSQKLCLYFSSVRRPSVFDVEAAKKLIQAKLSTKWAANWPAPLGRFVVGEIDAAQLIQAAVECEELDEPSTEQGVQIEFYKGTKALERGLTKAFLRHMKLCSELEQAEDEYEVHLARYEVQKG